MLKKIFNPKRKRQEPGRHNTNKITLDPASAAILSRHFSPLSSRAKSPSDLLDIVGYPLAANTAHYHKFSQSSPDLSTPLNEQDENSKTITSPNAITAATAAGGDTKTPTVSEPTYRLTIRNMTTPLSTSTSSPDLTRDQLLLETSREDKTLVEKEALDHTLEVYRLQQKLLEFENEREAWLQKLRGYIEREEQMRKIIKESQLQINQLKYGYYSSATTPSRHDSYRTISTHSSSWPTEPEEEELEEEEEDPEEEENLEADEERLHYDVYQHHHHRPLYPLNNQHLYQYYDKRRYYDYHYYPQQQQHQQRHQSWPSQQQQHYHPQDFFYYE
ncbi:hypothetical protein V8B55DRAFT_1485549 [Mucor lusitanicus]|uniref:Uncharacterized protein n=1 Tax=Mucor lusitanicus CBS 277.49 TaxID=747725 RepID=A0A168HS73_MUCCL|nr:hypothetical protein MUCCIDRAFT_166569 [Mucor lusitanicus CBS 277.49]